MPKAINISAARRDLPSLFDRVTGRRGEMVVIRRRDGEREAVLVDREYVEALEAANRRLAMVSGFRLIGSGEAVSDIEVAIAEIRADDLREGVERRTRMAPRTRRRSAP